MIWVLVLGTLWLAYLHVTGCRWVAWHGVPDCGDPYCWCLEVDGDDRDFDVWEWSLVRHDDGLTALADEVFVDGVFK